MGLQTIRLHVVTLRRETAEAHTPLALSVPVEGTVSNVLIHPAQTKHTDQYANMSI